MIPLLSLIALLQFPRDFVNQLIGTWINHDSATMGITEIVIANENGALHVHAWGACTPLDCYWGAAELGLKEGTQTAVFNQGPVTTTVYLVRLPNDKLLVSYKSHVAERPNYEEPDRTELFERQQPSTGDMAARTLLEKVSQSYSNLTTAEFEYENVFQFTDQTTAKRSNHLTHIWLSSSGRWRTETSGSGERVVWISDGKSMWRFFPESNQYTVDPGPNTHSPLVSNYGSLDKVRGTTTITGSERLGNFNCTVIRVERPDSVRTLWIDSKSNFVVKDDSTVTSSTPPDVETSRLRKNRVVASNF
jgi:outer membrane lipoprotein-sorting protein